MRDAILPWAVMAVTVIVAVGLLTFFRHLLKLREQQAPELVHAGTTVTEAKPAAAAPVHHDLAA
jgi:hypothetical protein